MSPDALIQKIRTRSDGRERPTLRLDAGYTQECMSRGRTMVTYLDVATNRRAAIVRMTRDNNGINLFMVYADGSKEVRNISPRAYMFSVQADIDLDLQDNPQDVEDIFRTMEELSKTF